MFRSNITKSGAKRLTIHPFDTITARAELKKGKAQDLDRLVNEMISALPYETMIHIQVAHRRRRRISRTSRRRS